MAIVKKLFNYLILSIGLLLSGCASNPSIPQEAPISVQIKGTSIEVQNFIEERMRVNSSGVFYIENSSDRSITLKANCNRLPNQKPLQCGLIMMGIGNSHWDGPYLMMTFRTADIRGTINVTLQSEWCAINAFGKSNCMPAGTNNEHNEILRNMKRMFEADKPETNTTSSTNTKSGLIKLATDLDGKACQSTTDCDPDQSCRSKTGGGSVCKKIN
jgi:hypothetical protein